MLITNNPDGTKMTPRQMSEANRHLFSHPHGDPYTKEEVILVIENYMDIDKVCYPQDNPYACSIRETDLHNFAVESSLPSNLCFGFVCAVDLEPQNEAIGFEHRRELGGWILVVKRPRPIGSPVWTFTGDILTHFEMDMDFLPKNRHFFCSWRDAWKFLKMFAWNRGEFTGNGICKYCRQPIMWYKRNGRSYPYSFIYGKNGKAIRTNNELWKPLVGELHTKTCGK